jgi:hypothetical protein
MERAAGLFRAGREARCRFRGERDIETGSATPRDPRSIETADLLPRVFTRPRLVRDVTVS